MHLRDSYAAPAALHERLAPLHVGSNNWVVGPRRSASGEAMVVNDPHLDSRLLPGVWYPVGLSAGDFHAAGVALPGLPGIVIGRTRHVAFGVTNAYGDVQDLFIEQIDPTSEAHYLEGDVRVPFEVREEVIRVRDGDAPGGFREETLTVRSTRRGPIVSDHGMVDLGDRLVSLRWGAASAFRSEIGFDNLLYARSAAEVDVALKQIDIHMFNFVFADVDGHFGRRSTGRIPIRRQGQGLLPTQVTDSAPMWTDWIPKDEMPVRVRSRARLDGHREQRHAADGVPLHLLHLLRARLPLSAHGAIARWQREKHRRGSLGLHARREEPAGRGNGAAARAAPARSRLRRHGRHARGLVACR